MFQDGMATESVGRRPFIMVLNDLILTLIDILIHTVTCSEVE